MSPCLLPQVQFVVMCWCVQGREEVSPGLMEGWAASSPELVGTCLPQFAAFLGTALRAGGHRHHNLMDRAMMVKKPPIAGETALQR